ncbi:flotillin family protein [Solimonas marina]|uniref:Band 7 domain-containing protein n=1 Tax=Solimonas marina TaxID=2714601 RepID=A0A969WB61_9GAMM|nr:flotillin domain-containing protein [Solimonas marina]NKF22788.1 hypothetical protein [Solimonas marina]
MDQLIFIGVSALTGLIIIAFIGLTLSRLWRRATPERAIVRTGGGKEFVTMTGGCFQIPVIHEITVVNMSTMRLDIERTGERSLITRDRLRVDANVAFFTRVIRTAEGISTAAKSLGRRTYDTDEIRKLIESKFDDVIRAVAMGMTLSELLDQRDQFRQMVLKAVSADLEKNGLELEAVSVTTLNQTDLKFFKDDNVIDAEGKTLITRETESRRRERNDITQETEVAIAQRNLEASQRKFSIRQAEEQARLEQEEKVANLTAEQNARVAAVRAEQEKRSKQADIETARAVEQSEIARRQGIEIAEQQRRIAIAQKSSEQSAAEAEANKARAEAAKSEQDVVTANEVARAERERRVAVIVAEQQAEQQAVATRVAAKTERDAAEDRANAVLTVAKANADAMTIEADGLKAKQLAEAEGRRAINESENALSKDIIALRQALAVIEKLPAILEAQAKPIEAIDDLKVVLFPGAPGTTGANGNGQPAAANSANGGLAQQLTDMLLSLRMQSPMVDAALKSAGLLDETGKLGVPTSALSATEPAVKAAA